MRLMALAAALLFAVQDDAAKIDALITALGSESVEERTKAAEGLRALGPAARTALQKAAQSKDLEIAARAKEILRVGGLELRVSPAVRRAIPGVIERLLRGAPAEWTRVFEEATASTPAGPAHPELTAADLDPLLEPALRGAPTPRERWNICEVGLRLRCPSAPDGVKGFLREPDERVRATAYQGIARYDLRALIPDLVEIVKSGPARSREFAADTLARMKPVEARDAVAGLLREQNPELWKAGALLARSMPPEQIPPLLEPLLLDPRAELRWIAATDLGYRRLPCAVPELRARLKDPSPQIRTTAVVILGAYRSKEYVADLLPLLKDENDEVGREVLMALSSSLESKEAVPALLSVAREQQGERRALTLRALVRLKAVEAIPELVRSLEDPDRQSRASALQGLLELKATGAASSMARCVKDGQPGVRCQAILSLSLLGAKDAAPAVRAALTDPDYFVRLHAIHGVRLLQDAEATPALLDLVQDVMPELARCATDSLIAMKATGIVPRIVEQLADEKCKGRDGLVWLLSYLGGPAHRDVVKKFLSDPEPHVRFAAAEALWRLGSDDGVPAVVALIEDPDPWKRARAAYQLGEMKARSAIPALLKAVDDPRHEVQFRAVEALATLRVPESVPKLLTLLSGTNEQQTTEAVRAMGDLEVREAEARLIELAETKRSDLKFHAGVALCRLGSKQGVAALLQGPENTWPRGPAFALNALRTPEVWAKLSLDSRSDPRHGDLKERVERWSKETGLPIEQPALGPLEPTTTSWGCRNKRGVFHELPEFSSSSVPYLRQGWSSWEPILEKDRIRVVPRGDAVKFWRAWWEEERKK
jgi:HEAT repeat protein